jgi:SHS family lactate transporter-like MFS transporter
MREIGSAMLAHKGMFLYLLLMMSVLLCLSHGAQDLYPDFLKSMPRITSRSVFGVNALYGIPILYNAAAIAGAILFGQLSQRWGRRNAINLALGIALAAIPAWAFGGSAGMLAAGSCVMMAGIQGAFGVIPAHLNELSPDVVRGLFPGIVYQAGVLLAAPAPKVEFRLRDWLGYPWALTCFEAGMIVLMVVTVWLGPEARDRSFAVERADQ